MGDGTGTASAERIASVSVQLAEFKVGRLFRQFDHVIPFPPRQDEAAPSLVLLHGQNGVGKTTTLQMLDGLLTLNFDVFRRVPFRECSLEFTTGEDITVAHGNRKSGGLIVEFKDHRVELASDLGKKGALRPEDEPKVEKFRHAFYSSVLDVSFELIGTAREARGGQASSLDPNLAALHTAQRHLVSSKNAASKIPRSVQDISELEQSLGYRVRRFISDAQVEYRRFFTTTEPDLFAQIINRLKGGEWPEYGPKDLIRRLKKLRAQDEDHSRLGIEPDRWDLDEITGFLRNATGGRSDATQEALGVVGAYVEMLESRARERDAVAQRLLKFERLMNDFYLDKTVEIDRRYGLRIKTNEKHLLSEDDLSSGEYHLLYLMVSALLARRQGTVLAIDEPEMSMHISWQRKLIRALIECASNAAPQFIFATHSPDVVSTFSDSMIQLGPGEG